MSLGRCVIDLDYVVPGGLGGKERGGFGFGFCWDPRFFEL